MLLEIALNIVINPVVWLAVGILVKNRLDKKEHRWGWFWWFLLYASVVSVIIGNLATGFGWSEETRNWVSGAACVPADVIAVVLTVKSLRERRQKKRAQAVAERNRQWQEKSGQESVGDRDGETGDQRESLGGAYE